MPYFTNRAITPLPVGGGAWTPATVSPAFWYDASNVGSTHVDGSNNITSWDDLSGNSKTLTLAGGGALNSVLVSSVQNSLPGVRFDQSGVNGSQLVTTSNITLAQPFTVIAAVQTINAPAAFSTLFMDETGTAVALFMKHSSVGDDPTIYAGTAISIGSDLSGITSYVIYGQYNSTSSVGGVNSVAGSTGNAGTGALSSAKISIGRTGDTLQLSAYVLELFGFSGVSGTDLTSAHTYLNTKWMIY